MRFALNAEPICAEVMRQGPRAVEAVLLAQRPCVSTSLALSSRGVASHFRPVNYAGVHIVYSHLSSLCGLDSRLVMSFAQVVDSPRVFRAGATVLVVP